MSNCDHCETLANLGLIRITSISKAVRVISGIGVNVCQKHFNEYYLVIKNE